MECPHPGHDSPKFDLNASSVAGFAAFSGTNGVIHTSAEQPHFNGVQYQMATRHKIANKTEIGKR